MIIFTKRAVTNLTSFILLYEAEYFDSMPDQQEAISTLEKLKNLVKQPVASFEIAPLHQATLFPETMFD